VAQPDSHGPYAGRYRHAANRILPGVLYVLPLFIIFIRGRGQHIFKLASPTDAAALGCLASLAACYFFRLFKSIVRISGIAGADFNWRAIAKALMETAKINTHDPVHHRGFLVFSQALSNSGATDGLLQYLATRT
jgi:TRAP-type mannitol/chloroaromatic compound transport system permease large subunit